MLIAEDGLTLRYVASSDEIARQLERAHEQSGEGRASTRSCSTPASRPTTCTSEDALALTARRAARPADPRRPRPADARRHARRHAQRLLRAAARVGRQRGLGARGLQRPARGAPGRGAGRARRMAASSISCQFALDSRVTIERAVGLLMGRDGLDDVAAFQELRRTARSTRRRVVDGRRGAARRTLARGGRLATGPGGYSSSG